MAVPSRAHLFQTCDRIVSAAKLLGFATLIMRRDPLVEPSSPAYTALLAGYLMLLLAPSLGPQRYLAMRTQLIVFIKLLTAASTTLHHSSLEMQLPASHHLGHWMFDVLFGTRIFHLCWVGALALPPSLWLLTQLALTWRHLTLLPRDCALPCLAHELSCGRIAAFHGAAHLLAAALQPSVSTVPTVCACIGRSMCTFGCLVITLHLPDPYGCIELRRRFWQTLSSLGMCTAQLLFLTVLGGILLPMVFMQWPLERQPLMQPWRRWGWGLDQALARLVALLQWPRSGRQQRSQPTWQGRVHAILIWMLSWHTLLSALWLGSLVCAVQLAA